MRRFLKVLSGLLIISCLLTGCTGLGINKESKVAVEGVDLSNKESSQGYAIDEEKVYNYEDVKDVVIRFHVLANSDTEEDQNLKLKVRDEILNYLQPYLQNLQSREEAKKEILDKQDEIKKISLKVIKDNGYSYGVRTELARENFPEKSYGKITLPQGNYEAIRVIIGNGEGHNWWCVMFPALCFIDVTKGQVEEKKSQAELDKVIEENKQEKVDVKFKIVEVIRNFFR